GAPEQPAVERTQVDTLDAALEVGPAWLEALDVGVVDEELERVPEGEKAALHLLSGTEAEADVLPRRLLAVEVAHDVRAHARERLLHLDHVSPGAVHLATLDVEQLLEGQHALVRRAAGEDDRHEQERVEPEPDLLAHLGHPV